VGLRSYLNDLEMRKTLPLTGLELRHLGRPARSQPLYRLSYLGKIDCLIFCIFKIVMSIIY
jgi:hypothetical protein